jgi:hypothetical protein
MADKEKKTENNALGLINYFKLYYNFKFKLSWHKW